MDIHTSISGATKDTWGDEKPKRNGYDEVNGLAVKARGLLSVSGNPHVTSNSTDSPSRESVDLM